MKPATFPNYLIEDWIKKVIIRPVQYADLRSMEWEGAYTHFRKVYQRTYQKACDGKTRMWVADLPELGVIAQVFIQLESNRRDLADGSQRAYLYALRVRPSFRNQGLGEKLILFSENDVQQRNFSVMTLNVAQNNPGAIRLYQRLGYQIVGTEKGDWAFRDHKNNLRRIIEPAWKMEKRLSPS